MYVEKKKNIAYHSSFTATVGYFDGKRSFWFVCREDLATEILWGMLIATSKSTELAAG